MNEAVQSMSTDQARSQLRSQGAQSLNDASSDLILDEPTFVRMLRLDRKRTERSGRPFVLMLLESSHLLKSDGDGSALEKVLSALALSTRETDIKGWFKSGVVLGVIFTEIDRSQGKAVAMALLSRVTQALCGSLGIEDINEIRISFHVYPEDAGGNGQGGRSDRALYPDLDSEGDRRRMSHAIKRSIDIAASLCALVVFSPLLGLIALAIRFTSRGPVLFRQQRVGMFGRRFTFLKFRSMYVASDDTLHKEYVRNLIAGSKNESGTDSKVYKLTNDPRVTPLGRLLRKTSLDELPQLINVLTGQMSLVGPRPAIPYEVEAYDVWHRRRILAVKPGITGLWQVTGRSTVKFDDMIRLDLRYATTWSLWLDLRILLQTPRAVLFGSGAY
jgi:lipopolysaccharide/colanic/teichoic acid biosynthesis glycosyltransferase